MEVLQKERPGSRKEILESVVLWWRCQPALGIKAKKSLWNLWKYRKGHEEGRTILNCCHKEWCHKETAPSCGQRTISFTLVYNKVSSLATQYQAFEKVLPNSQAKLCEVPGVSFTLGKPDKRKVTCVFFTKASWSVTPFLCHTFNQSQKSDSHFSSDFAVCCWKVTKFFILPS